MIALIKHSVDNIPLICCLLSDLIVLSALLIPGDLKYLCNPVVTLELYRRQEIHRVQA